MAALVVNHDHSASCGGLRPRLRNQIRERGGAPLQRLTVGIGEGGPFAAFRIQRSDHRPVPGSSTGMIASDRVLAKAVR